MGETSSDEQTALPVGPRSFWRIRWTRRKLMWLASLLGILVPVSWFAWTIFGWPAAIRISRETTWLTDPVDADGYIDYLQFVRSRHLALGVQPTEDDHWLQLEEGERPFAAKNELLLYQDPAVVIAAARAAMVVEEGKADQSENAVSDPVGFSQTELENEVLPRLQFIPWTTAEYPDIASVVQQNSAWYKDVVGTFTELSAVTYPESSTNGEGVAVILLPAAGNNRIIANRFLLRSSLRFGNGQVEDALQDIQFVYQIAERDRLFLIGQLNGSAIESNASRCLICGLLNADEISPSTIEFLDQLPCDSVLPELIEMVDAQTRLMYLEMLQCMHRNPRENEFVVQFKGRPVWLQKMLARRWRNAVDWNEILEAENKYFDLAVEAMSDPDFQRGFNRLKNAWDVVPETTSTIDISTLKLWQRRPTTDEVIQCLPAWHCQFTFAELNLIQQAFLAANERLMRRRVVQIVARLAVWKQIHGEFPAELKVLKSLTEFSTEREDLLIDPFTNQQFVYRKTKDGLELTSCGINGVQDGRSGTELEVDVSRAPTTGSADEYIWRWPLPDEAQQ